MYCQPNGLRPSAMIRGINSIYTQDPYVQTTNDITHFCFLIKSWPECVGHLHNLEGTLKFPGFDDVVSKRGFLKANINQHHAFEPELKKLAAFANGAKAKDYRSNILQGIIDDFANSLQEHLHDEMPTFLAIRPHDGAALLKVYKM